MAKLLKLEKNLNFCKSIPVSQLNLLIERINKTDLNILDKRLLLEDAISFSKAFGFSESLKYIKIKTI